METLDFKKPQSQAFSACQDETLAVAELKREIEGYSNIRRQLTAK